jgi:hypothetical protein
MSEFAEEWNTVARRFVIITVTMDFVRKSKVQEFLDVVLHECFVGVEGNSIKRAIWIALQ